MKRHYPIVGYGIAFCIINLISTTVLFCVLNKPDVTETTLPIAIVSFAESIGVELGDIEQLNQNFQRAEKAIAQLSEAGFIVLDAQAVLSAPQKHYVSPSLLYDARLSEAQ